MHRSVAYDPHEERMADSWISMMNAINVALYEASENWLDRWPDL